MSFPCKCNKHRYEVAVNELHNDHVKGITTTYPATLNAAYTYLDDIKPMRVQGDGNQFSTSFLQA